MYKREVHGKCFLFFSGSKLVLFELNRCIDLEPNVSNKCRHVNGIVQHMKNIYYIAVAAKLSVYIYILYKYI